MRSATSILLLAGLSFGQMEATIVPDSAAPHPAPQVAPIAAKEASPAPADTAKPVVVATAAPPTSAATAPATSVRAGEDWQLALDFADIAGSGHVRTRHFHHTAHQTNVCCLDAAWFPLAAGSGRLRAGGFADVGGWSQNLPDATSVLLADLTVGGSVLGAIPIGTFWGVWTRADLGLSNLLIQRRTTGLDWGVGYAIRAGVSLRPWGRTIFLGAGFDGRDYLNVDLKDVPAVTLSFGGWL